MHILKNGYLFALWLPDYGWKAIREINTRANWFFPPYTYDSSITDKEEAKQYGERAVRRLNIVDIDGYELVDTD